MTKPSKLKQNLKASDRRRRRRVQTTQPLPTAASQRSGPSAPPLDLLGLFVDAILHHAKQTPSSTIDLVVVAALRSAQKGTMPSDDEASRLTKQFLAIGDRKDVSEKEFLEATRQLLAMSREHQNSTHKDSKNVEDRFVQYLSILAG